MAKEKPLGMRIGESVFCVGYLAFALVAGCIFLSQRDGASGAFAATCAIMTLLLGCGDAFHLVPRILSNMRGNAKTTAEEQSRHFWLGLGNLVSSITMTVFYVLLPKAMQLMPTVGTEQAPAGSQLLHILLVGLAIVRMGLCLMPQNRWFDGEGSQEWGIRRNIPFVAMGVITVLYLIVWYRAWLMALLVIASFACYMGVVLLAREKPMMGMLMIPKTICYIWMISLFLGAL